MMTKTFSIAKASFALALIFLVSCKKDDVTPSKSQPKTTLNRNELTKDSMFLYAKELYLWNNELPSYDEFDPRANFNSSSDHLVNLNRELFAITRYSRNPLTGEPYEYNSEFPEETKYSYIDDLVAEGKLAFAKNAQSSVDFNGEGNDLGLSLTLIGNTQVFKTMLRFASPGSPVALAGLGRGTHIEKINGRNVGTNYSDEVGDFIYTALEANSITLAGTKANGTAFNVTLNKTKYNSSPIFKDTVLLKGTKKIGYLAYARFTDDNNSDLPLTNVFNRFSNAGVTDLVIDLRYNPGGYVSTAEHLLNLIAPSNLNGKTMFVETYNATLQSGKASILRNQPLRDQQGNIVYKGGRMANYADDISYTQKDNTTIFNKEGSLNGISKVVFITTGGTASASELVINSLRPYLTVKTVGSKSYGKPVGFFPIRIDKYDIYMSSFSTTNANGEGNYFAGIVPDAESDDDVLKDFGNPVEASLATAVSYLVNGSFPSTASRSVNSTKSSAVGNTLKNNIFEPEMFKGMIGTPKKSK